MLLLICACAALVLHIYDQTGLIRCDDGIVSASLKLIHLVTISPLLFGVQSSAGSECAPLLSPVPVGRRVGVRVAGNRIGCLFGAEGRAGVRVAA